MELDTISDLKVIMKVGVSIGLLKYQRCGNSWLLRNDQKMRFSQWTEVTRERLK
ncbi:hypothetical protein KIN20_018919 [Parelaphostrongylus tenuis]|uniref:Uncharacterized protein n=1 Tax=Parelaphostrongylus tenuis TaxID=148309 RepID=A0AAD5QSJ2_PARTN|nr:hypothetical protein KIN20_018919 [Parelaphostrongylus tenuis]